MPFGFERYKHVVLTALTGVAASQQSAAIGKLPRNFAAVSRRAATNHIAFAAMSRRKCAPSNWMHSTAAQPALTKEVGTTSLIIVSHELLDEISLELGKRTSVRLRQQPALLQVARENIARWSQQNSNAPSLLRCYAEWTELLNQPLDAICAVLCGSDDASRRLRQNSPFAGVLDAREVWEVKSHFRHAASAA